MVCSITIPVVTIVPTPLINGDEGRWDFHLESAITGRPGVRVSLRNTDITKYGQDRWGGGHCFGQSVKRHLFGP